MQYDILKTAERRKGTVLEDRDMHLARSELGEGCECHLQFFFLALEHIVIIRG